jgi:hypothetical protein
MVMKVLDTHCPAGLQLPVEQVPHEVPQVGSVPHWRLPQVGTHGCWHPPPSHGAIALLPSGIGGPPSAIALLPSAIGGLPSAIGDEGSEQAPSANSRTPALRRVAEIDIAGCYGCKH